MTEPKQKTNLTSINVLKPELETIKLLETILEQAKTGELQQVAIATINREGVVQTAISVGLNIQQAVFALTTLRLRVEALINVTD